MSWVRMENWSQVTRKSSLYYWKGYNYLVIKSFSLIKVVNYNSVTIPSYSPLKTARRFVWNGKESDLLWQNKIAFILGLMPA